MLQKNKNIFFFIFFISIVCNPTIAKTQEDSLWKDLGLYGGQIPAIAVDPENSSTLYAGSWTGDGLFKSVDGGANWSSIPWFKNMDVSDIEIDPNDSSTLWVAYKQYIAVSHDAGNTWKSFHFASLEGRFCYTVAVDPFDLTGNTVYVGTGGPDGANEYGEIFTTIDGGETWDPWGFDTQTNTRNNFCDITFNPGIPGEIWAANRKSYSSPDGRVYVSPDYGESWFYWGGAFDLQGTFQSFSYIDEVLINPVDPLKIFLSSQYGVARKNDGQGDAAWQWTSTFGDSCRAMCIPPSAPNIIYAGLPDTIAKSTDSGDTWDET
ncbi:MAG: hypothetical protein WCQ99_12360, partial [Pseudomonadota bacterium]